MNNRRLFIMFIILIILIIIVSFILLKLSSNKKKNGSAENIIDDEIESNGDIMKSNDVYEAEEYEYYIMDQRIEDFLDSLVYEDSEYVYEVIDKVYAEQNQINEANIISKLKYSDNYQRFETDKLYCKQVSDEGKSYFVYGYVYEKNQNGAGGREFNCIINVNMLEGAYSISPANTNDFNAIGNDELSKMILKIEINEYNSFATAVISNENKARKLFDKYKFDAIYYPGLVYDMLDEEYKNKKFESLDTYKNYVAENRDYLNQLTISKYSMTEKEDYQEYKIQDNMGNMYTFDVKKHYDFTLKLDEYTILTEEFKNSYYQSSIEQKIGTNTQIFMAMLDSKDYKSAYNCLSQGFKQNYFPTLEDFKRYAKENFFVANELAGVKIENEGDVFMITVDISDYTKQNEGTIRKTFIMQLGEGTDFVMSFNVE